MGHNVWMPTPIDYELVEQLNRLAMRFRDMMSE